MLRRAAVLCLLLLAAAAGCGRSGSGAAGGQDTELVILASQGLQDLDFLQAPMEAAVGRKIRFEYTGAVEMADRLRSSGSYAADFVWPASGFYLRLNVPQRILASEDIMQSPVVFALKKPRAEELGWERRPPSWAEIAQTVVHDQLSLATASPVVSDLGLAALFSVCAATTKDPRTAPEDADLAILRQLYSGTHLIGGSPLWLADTYVKQEARLDGMINYEASILALDAGTQLSTPLLPIHPRDGAIAADYPLMLVNPARALEYNRLVAFLHNRTTQQQIVNRTWRRPLGSHIKLPQELEGHRPVVLPEPGRQGFVDAVLDDYQTQLRLPSHSYFDLDISGSMAQEHRMDELKAALLLLAGSEPGTFAGRYARFQPREKTNLTSFNSRIVDRLGLDFAGPDGYGKARERFEDFVAALQPEGGTAIYDALQATYQQALNDRKLQPNYYPSIVLMTDGESSSGIDFEAFRNWYEALPDTARDIPVYVIQFGEADAREMKALADLTGGRVFDAKNNELSAVFKDVRGYQ
jgi:Ca-activated chloride channel family protein